MKRRTQYAITFGLVFALTVAAVGAVLALPPNPYSSAVYCSAWPYTDQLTATVTRNLDGTYHYQYDLSFSGSAFSEPLTGFRVGNVYNLPYTNPGCSKSFTIAPSVTSVYWYLHYGDVQPGTQVSFWFDSVYSYTEVDVTIDAGLPANGKTLGMIPEPCSMCALVFGLGGIALARLRRRR